VAGIGLLLCLAEALQAQEGGGQAEIGFQQYYLSIGSQRIANISGLALTYGQFLPDVGLVSASLSPALSNDQFRTGDDYLRLKGLPWKGQHWNFSIGDFRLPEQLLAAPFTNLYFPDIAGRGVLVEATHEGRTIGFFYGTETIANTPRVVLRVAVPQTLAGLYVRQKIGSRLILGARLMHFSNNLTALASMPSLLTESSPLRTATTLMVDGLYTIAGPLKWYGEATWSASEQNVPNLATRRTPFSTLAGPLVETKHFKLRANYTFENTSYFPLLGYNLGDRQGPFGEVTLRPVSGLEVYGSASEYQNNVAADPTAPSFRSTSESAGASLQLPARFSLNGQLTLLDLDSRLNSGSPWDKSKNQQETVTLGRAFAHHNLQVSARDFKQISDISPQRQRSAEIQDTLHVKHLVLGAGVKVQRLVSDDSRTNLLYRGMVQLNVKRLSVFANIETGSDLQNRTLLATNTISTTVVGASWNVGRQWEFQAEAFRNNLLTTLNPQSIFVLQGQGVFVPGTLAALNQWSIYFRMSRKLQWGKAGMVADLGQYAIARVPLKGSLEGFVMERLIAGNRPAEGVPVSLDGSRTAVTGADGRFHFSEVPEGAHNVGLALLELPADFDPGPNKEKGVVVYPNKLARSDLDVIRLVSLQGKVSGPPDVPVENIVIRMAGTQRYTTPDSDGNFYFYNLREGDYTLAVDQKTLPEYAVMDQPDSISVTALQGRAAEPVNFRFEVHAPEKAVRKVFEKTLEAPPPPGPPKPPAGPAPPRSDPDSVTPPVPPVIAAPPGTGAGANGGVRVGANQSLEAAQRHQLAGRQLTQAGRYREAIAELDEAIRLSPRMAAAYNARGYARYLLRNYAGAIEDLTQAIRLNPKYVNAYEIRSWAKRAAGDLTGAAADLQRAKQLGQ